MTQDDLDLIEAEILYHKQNSYPSRYDEAVERMWIFAKANFNAPRLRFVTSLGIFEETVIPDDNLHPGLRSLPAKEDINQ